MRTMAKETHIKTDKKTYWRLGCLGVTNIVLYFVLAEEVVGIPREYPKLCVLVLAHAVKTGHLLNRSGYRIANWFRAATHSLTQRPFFSKLRMAR